MSLIELRRFATRVEADLARLALESEGIDAVIFDAEANSFFGGGGLIGDGPTVLTRVKGIGNDMALDEGVGICGKGGQSVPAGVGQPTLLIDGLTVGGTAA